MYTQQHIISLIVDLQNTGIMHYLLTKQMPRELQQVSLHNNNLLSKINLRLSVN